MSSIASPRPSSGLQSPTSSRSSLSIDRPTVAGGGQRRNRSALRDYYNLNAESTTHKAEPPVNEDQSPTSELDRSEFDAASYTSRVLENESLESLLQVESGLVGEIRGLDGERKALVYDNYSKLIAATDTIRRMRTNMDPLAPMTTTLEPAMGHIAQTASQLSDNLRENVKTSISPSNQEKTADRNKLQTVQWVLNTPERLRSLVKDGKTDQAVADWSEVQGVLDKWVGVPGVEEIRQQAQTIMAG